jgi:crossover junction endodeoxyribonuclease RuvC
MIVLACDPGKQGAVAWVHSSGALIAVADMPVVEVNGKRRIGSAELARIMAVREAQMIVIEGVWAIPRREQDGKEVGMGSASSFSFGYSAGIIEGIAAAMTLPMQIIPAAVWKRRAGVSRDKGAARMMAQRLWPASATLFTRVRDDGRAEAALLARFVALGNGSAAAVAPAVRRSQSTQESSLPLIG